ncbi:major facilitator superfamily domain-containing protein [Absidia repens]|uniref:Major facilitator superfamily domain-containing protein n=1 Tax=Absidia repens TaxID=90262 RepID=A0A1X2IBV9_9FUNG|nr:major facilitator superfamily domain-containing protein [Absidia repens]
MSDDERTRLLSTPASSEPQIEYLNQQPPDQVEQQEEKFKDLIPHLRPLFTACFMSLVVGMNDGAIGVLIPQFKKYYGISNQTLSFLFLSNVTGYIICAPFNGVLVNSRLGQKGTLYMAGGLVLLAYLLIMNGFDFRLTCLLMVVQGSGIALLDAGMNVLTAHLPFATLMLNVVHAIYGVGAMLSPVVGTSLLQHQLSWKWLYGIMSCVSLLNLLVITVGLRQTGSESPAASTLIDDDTVSDDDSLSATFEQTQIDKSTKEMINEAILNRTTLLCTVYILIYVGLEVTLGGWGYTYLVEGKHGDPISMGKVLSMYWGALAIGRIILGYISGRYGEKRSVTIFTLLTLIGICCIWKVDDLRVDATVFVLIGALLGPMFPTAISLTSKTLPKELYPTSIGFIAGVGASGAAFLPFLTGQIAGHYGMLCLPIVCLVMGAVMQIAWLFI